MAHLGRKMRTTTNLLFLLRSRGKVGNLFNPLSEWARFFLIFLLSSFFSLSVQLCPFKIAQELVKKSTISMFPCHR